MRFSLYLAISLLFTVCETVNANTKNIDTKNVVGRDSLDFQLKDGTRLQLELWFPAVKPQSKLGQHKDYAFSKHLKRGLVEVSGMPSMAISTRETSNGYRNVMPQPGSFPLIIFSHGSASFSRQNSRQLEALASAGYIVIAPSHPSDSLATEYQDGTTVTIDRSQPMVELLGVEADKKYLHEALGKVSKASAELRQKSVEEYADAIPDFVTNTLFIHYVASARRRADQVGQLVRQLIVADPQIATSVLRQADTARIALYGHSLGGVVSVLAAESLNTISAPDSILNNISNVHASSYTIQAVVNLDTLQFVLPHESSLELVTPTCFVMGGATKMSKVVVSNLGLNRPFAETNLHTCEINIPKAAHNNFTDLTYITPLKWFGLLGPIKNKRFGQWLEGFLVAYFDSKLKGKAYDYPLWPGADLNGTI